MQWLATNGPRVLAVIVFVFLARWISRLVGRKVVAAIVRRRGSLQGADRDARAETLGRVFQNATGTAILVLGTLAILDQVGVNVTVLLGGAAVIGAAVAFGSQNLIRDFVAGFMILVENQYSVGSVVKIGDVSGVVEDISLRTTVLRDEEGVVHFIPHGQINTVSNMTYSWSRAVLTIAVSYKEDVDRVMQILLEVAQQLSHDPGFSHSIIDEPEMLGVDALGDSSVSIKFLIKTRPMRQWAVKREVLRRIKKKFDELGIAIPFSQRVVQLVHVET
ncbi:mechanosensitive ion channel family protein [Anatilimnocola floriformis]|uniref:mechanosensitive ion channel family protein n=1 Tax=Anatilimnocola floriformis TaxID=2948575 RepID=UPI0020C28580|nr:mechanosensitive ion channel family protein [Anatilimnocola floriformis]